MKRYVCRHLIIFFFNENKRERKIEALAGVTKTPSDSYHNDTLNKEACVKNVYKLITSRKFLEVVKIFKICRCHFNDTNENDQEAGMSKKFLYTLQAYDLI